MSTQKPVVRSFDRGYISRCQFFHDKPLATGTRAGLSKLYSVRIEVQIPLLLAEQGMNTLLVDRLESNVNQGSLSACNGLESPLNCGAYLRRVLHHFSITLEGAGDSGIIRAGSD